LKSLHKAFLGTILDSTNAGFWREVAKSVPGKNADQCHQKHSELYGEKKTRKKKFNNESRQKREDSPLRITKKANLKTAKSRRKIRNILQKNSQSQEQSDAFDSQEFRNKYGEISDDDNETTEVSEFEELGNKTLKSLLNAHKALSQSPDADQEVEVPSYIKNTDPGAYDNYVTRYSKLRTGSRGRKGNTKNQQKKRKKNQPTETE